MNYNQSLEVSQEDSVPKINKTQQFGKLNQPDVQPHYCHQGIVQYEGKQYIAILRDYLFNLKDGKLFLDMRQYQLILRLSHEGFQIQVQDYVFNFKTREKKEWLVAFNYFIQSALPCNTLVIPNFWNSHKISFEMFRQQADNLDILLYKGKTFAGSLQRLVTNSDFGTFLSHHLDHVALLLKSIKGELFVFESNSIDGVCIYGIDSLLTMSPNLEKICYKKLYFKREGTTLINLQEFVLKNHGKEYGISLQKLLKKQSIQGMEKLNFFCSELVASCYKFVGLIDQDVSSCQFWPSKFFFFLNNRGLRKEPVTQKC